MDVQTIFALFFNDQLVWVCMMWSFYFERIVFHAGISRVLTDGAEVVFPSESDCGDLYREMLIIVFKL